MTKKKKSSISKIISPLRYPGGKGAFLFFFSELIKINGLNGGIYFEPFAGGAGVGLGLLQNGLVSEIVLNDADYHIFCFWFSVLNENQRFLDRINEVSLNIDEWKKQRNVYENIEKYSIFEIGFSTFFLNRCNRSGIMVGAGPIGGHKQTGKWRLDARFNKKTLTNRIENIGKLSERISFYNMDAIKFLKKKIPQNKQRKNVLVYLDPPYISAGNKLYLNFYSDKDHSQLANYLSSQTNLNWIVTYDNNHIVQSLYKDFSKWLFNLRYSLQAKQKGTELLILSNQLKFPENKQLYTKKLEIMEEIIA